jgi:hypothetical protein
LQVNASPIGVSGSSVYALNAQLTLDTESTSAASPPAVENDGDADDAQPAASVQVSQKGQLFSQLQSLAQTDPAKFKQVLTDAANSLKEDAQQQSGQAADFLNGLADRLQKAADSGDASALRPSGGHGHHHHHGGDQNQAQTGSQVASPAGAAYGATQAQSSPDGSDAIHEAIAQVFQSLNAAVTAA